MPCRRQKSCPLVIKIGIPETNTSNLIRTTKYNVLTFLPIATLIQFKRVANVYFLFTAVLQFIPIISPLSPFSAIVPLLFVLAVSLLRTGIEQIGKYKFDRKANSNLFEVYITDEEQQNQLSAAYNWSTKRSDQIKVGDIIKINQDQRIPSDAILLATSLQDGKAYLETSSLDGEKNLKPRSVLLATQQIYSDYGKVILGTTERKNSLDFSKPLITVQQPSEQLYSFNGIIQFTDNSESKKKQFIKINQFLYRDSVLRNTKYVIAVVIYAGKHTKTMLNSGQRSQKMSKLQKQVNYYMIFVFALQFLLVVLCGILRIFLYYNTADGQFFIVNVQRQTLITDPAQAAITSGSYFILLNTMIPISLLVSIEIVKFGQGLLIQFDTFMKGSKQGNVNAFRSSINQELGMVEYMFTDKTGTLTRNQMALKELMAAGIRYKNQNTANNLFFHESLSNKLLDSPIFLNKLIDYDPKTYQKQEDQIKSDQHVLSNLLVFIMAACHQCILTEKQAQVKPQYHGSSPDQIALVSSASNLGFSFKANKLSGLHLSLKNDKQAQFKVLQVFEFNSDRKRMSVVIDYIHNGSSLKLLLCKGADNIIQSLLRSDLDLYIKQTKQYITQLSKQGLRTLLYGYRIISNDQYNQFNQKFVSFSEQDSPQKQQLIHNFEKNLILAGASGVEDKLQDQVSEVIADFVRANIKVSMLTGDKMQTAHNIAITCGIFTNDLKVVNIQVANATTDLFKAYCQLINSDTQFGIIVEGQAINSIKDSLYFLEMFQKCKSAVFCRITPKNKAQMVMFAKQSLKKLTLAIGDGANDVPMIMAANIGVGLYGNQGMNAVQASDFAIPEFKSLWRLIFVHGRWNYLRIADLIKYFFYKNIVYTFGQLWFGYFCSFSGQSIYNATYLILYNTIFTGGPVLVRALLEQDINYMEVISAEGLQKSQLKQPLIAVSQLNSPEKKQKFPRMPISVGLNSENNDKNIYPLPSNLHINPQLQYLFPKLYEHSQKQKSLTPKIFAFIVFQALVSSIVIFVIIYYSIEEPELSIYSITLYSAILTLVTVRICYQITYWNFILVATILFTSIVPYLVFIYIMDIFTFNLRGTFVELFTLPDFYLVVLEAAALAAIVMGIFGVFRKYYDPTALEAVRKQIKQMIAKNINSQKRSSRLSRQIGHQFQMRQL